MWRFGADGSLDVRMVGRDYHLRVRKQFPECRVATHHVERLVVEAERRMLLKRVNASWDEEYVSAKEISKLQYSAYNDSRRGSS